MRGLDQAVVLVTGGASGIGAACVERFVNEGAHVIIADVQDDAGRALAGRLGDTASFEHTDVTDEASVAGTFDSVIDRFGRLDVCFANAAVFGAVGPLADLRVEDLDLTLAINLRGVILTAQHAARVMTPARRGVILTTASPGGLIGGAGPAVYSASKAGIIGFSRAIAAELRPQGIRVMTVVPGAIASAMTAAAVVGDAADLDGTETAMAQNSMLGRAGVPADIAGTVAFLASDDAGYLTGSEVFVDAGYTHAGASAAFAGPAWSHSGALLEAGRTTS